MKGHRKLMTPIDAYQRFHEDSVRFLMAQNVILASEVAAKKGDAGLLERFKEFEAAGQPIYHDLYEYLCAHLFIAYISNFETFLENIATYVVRKHPKKLGYIQFKLADVIDASDQNSLVDRAIEEHLNRIMYKRPLEYLHEFCSLISIDRSTINSDWALFVEAKARRDLGVHAAWRCNSIYLRKVEEASVESNLSLGASAIPDTEDYLDSVVEALLRLAENIMQQVVAVHGREEV